MKLVDDSVRLAATDLSNHLSCRHLTELDLGSLRGDLEPPDWTNPFTDVLRELGLEHEQAYLAHLKLSGLSTIAFAPNANADLALKQTAEAMTAGVDVIYQPALGFGSWIGRADVLLRTSGESRLGDWLYEAVDCKLARDTRAATILQLTLYSECVRELQGVRPERMHVLTPGTGFNPVSFRTADYLAYYRLIARRLLEATGGANLESYPEPTSHCDVCRWWQTCDSRRRQDDHPCFVAGISRLQIEQLREWKVTTLGDISKIPLPLMVRPRRGSLEGYTRIREQARLQVEARQSGKRVFELLEQERDRGLARLPEPSPGDIFLDLEGDRFAGGVGLEYLFGIATIGDDGRTRYECRWAFNRDEEKNGFEWAIDAMTARLEQFPGAHVYHFGHYEPTALKRLMGQYATREDEIDRMLYVGAFVDLHSVVRQSLRAGIEEYSLKALESFHDFERETPLRDVPVHKRSIERALELSAAERIDDQAKLIIESYNRDDCGSAKSLRDWLERLRDEQVTNGTDVPRPKPGEAPDADWETQKAEVQALVDQLTSGVPADAADRTSEEHGRWILAYLLAYHSRENKASWWDFFRLRDLDPEDYDQDRNAVAGLRLRGTVGGTSACPIHRYGFPRQELGFREGGDLLYRDTSSTHWTLTSKLGTVCEIDLRAGTLDIKKTKATKDSHPTALFVDPRPPRQHPKPAALLELAGWVAKNSIDGAGPYRAARDLLLRKPPCLAGDNSCGKLQQQCEDSSDAARAMAPLLAEGVLPIQGPPGAGKTYTGARMICELVRAGRTVGVTALSHKVISNLLKEVVRAAKQQGLAIQCCQRVREVDDNAPLEIHQTTNGQPLSEMNAGRANVGGGTAWVWARDDYRECIDVLFIDEAGQMPLADVLAVATAAKSLVLLGDPAQLEQPQQGSHPDGVAVSALEHVLGERQTISPEVGIFLPKTWRLHPSICTFTSEIFYEERLQSRPGLEQQELLGTSPFSGAGLWFVPVTHRGNQSSCEEEVAMVDRIVRSLLNSKLDWLDSEGIRRRVVPSDILVVAPYNAQVSDLLSRLPEGARVGTVDKFQGQEAPIVVYSMTTSTPEDAPRGMEFLYNLNRMNVATSRARVASILVASESLLEPECRTPHQMKLANALCRYVELAQTVRLGDNEQQIAATATA
jgi:uncharacterized protein